MQTVKRAGERAQHGGQGRQRLGRAPQGAGPVRRDVLHPCGRVDSQSRHAEDEMYVATAAQARIVTTGGEAQFRPGAVIFVPAGEEYRFVDITEDLALLVVFGPA